MGIAQSMDEDKGKQQRPTRKPAANALKPVNENEIKVLLLGPGDTGKSNVQPAILSIHERMTNISCTHYTRYRIQTAHDHIRFWIL